MKFPFLKNRFFVILQLSFFVTWLLKTIPDWRYLFLENDQFSYTELSVLMYLYYFLATAVLNFLIKRFDSLFFISWLIMFFLNMLFHWLIFVVIFQFVHISTYLFDLSNNMFAKYYYLMTVVQYDIVLYSFTVSYILEFIFRCKKGIKK